MAVFAYKGRAGSGAVTGEIEADSRPAAVTALRAKGVIATSVQEKAVKAAAGAAIAKKLGGRVKDKDLAIYNPPVLDDGRRRSADRPVPADPLRAERLQDAARRDRRIAADVQGGATLAESFGKYPKTFDHLFTNMLAVGESGGVLDVVLQRSPATSRRRQAEGQGQERDGLPGDDHQRGVPRHHLHDDLRAATFANMFKNMARAATADQGRHVDVGHDAQVHHLILGVSPPPSTPSGATTPRTRAAW